MKPSLKQRTKTESAKQNVKEFNDNCRYLNVFPQILTTRNVTANMIIFGGESPLWRVRLVPGHFCLPSLLLPDHEVSSSSLPHPSAVMLSLTTDQKLWSQETINWQIIPNAFLLPWLVFLRYFATVMGSWVTRDKMPIKSYDSGRDSCGKSLCQNIKGKRMNQW